MAANQDNRSLIVFFVSVSFHPVVRVLRRCFINWRVICGVFIHIRILLDRLLRHFVILGRHVVSPVVSLRFQCASAVVVIFLATAHSAVTFHSAVVLHGAVTIRMRVPIHLTRGFHETVAIHGATPVESHRSTALQIRRRVPRRRRHVDLFLRQGFRPTGVQLGRRLGSEEALGLAGALACHGVVAEDKDGNDDEQDAAAADTDDDDVRRLDGKTR